MWNCLPEIQLTKKMTQNWSRIEEELDGFEV